MKFNLTDMQGFRSNEQFFLYSTDERLLAIAAEYQCTRTGIKFYRVSACKIEGNTATDENGYKFYIDNYDIKRLKEFMQTYK